MMKTQYSLIETLLDCNGACAYREKNQQQGDVMPVLIMMSAYFHITANPVVIHQFYLMISNTSYF